MTRVLIIPGLNGHPGFLMQTAPRLFPGWDALSFDHHLDLAADGVEGLAERAMAALEASGDEPAIVCGESFGGTVALTLARRWPERIQGLVLFSTFGWYPSAVARRASIALPSQTVLRITQNVNVNEPLRQATRLASLPGQLGLTFGRDVFDAFIHRPPSDAPAYLRKMELSLQFDARPWLGKLAVPAFVLVGNWDPVVPTSAGRELARAIPDAELHQLPGGHLVHCVRAERVAALVTHWAQAHALT